MSRCPEDKRRAVMTLLNDEEWGQWSDSQIAKRCAVDHKTVAAIRESHLGISQVTERKSINKHGQTTTINVANIGKTNKPRTNPPPEPEFPRETEADETPFASDDPKPPWITPDLVAKAHHSGRGSFPGNAGMADKKSSLASS